MIRRIILPGFKRVSKRLGGPRVDRRDTRTTPGRYLILRAGKRIDGPDRELRRQAAEVD
jgi:hypothetical protein